MRIGKFISKIVFGAVIISLVTTSFGGAWATAAYAAPAEEQAIEAGGGNNAVVGGLLVLGLLAMLSGGKKGGNSATPAKSTDTSQPQTTTTTQTQTTTPSITSPQSTTSQSITSNSASSGLTTDESKAFDLLNADRRANGLPALKVNMNLVRLAGNYGQDMINRNYFSHYNPEGQSPFERMRQAGISYRYAGENLAINSSVTAAEKAFMNSPGHRANILNSNYTEVGIGVRYDANGRVYVVQEFIGK
ncbi:CAP domain-containing protein [Sporomusa carbonis]|uniref:CAP domain-containing protein n=1 Tax=Sporomusa carbonis TaxID=3076075 RepID=UPI003C7AAD32